MGIVSRSQASLRFGGVDLDPDQITRELGRKPNMFHRAGEVTTLSGGRERIWRRGLWSLKATAAEPADLNSQIESLLSGMTEDLSVWLRLASTFRADIFCGLFMKEGNEGLVIAPSTLRRAAERGLHLDLDIYHTGAAATDSE